LPSLFQILNITHNLNIIEDGQVEVVISAMVHKVTPKVYRSVQRRAVSFQESDCSDQDAFIKGTLWTPPRPTAAVNNSNNDQNAEIPNSSSSPRCVFLRFLYDYLLSFLVSFLGKDRIASSRSQSFDIGGNDRQRGLSVSSSDSAPVSPGVEAADSAKTGRMLILVIVFPFLLSF
jgi:hypothetical protein